MISMNVITFISNIELAELRRLEEKQGTKNNIDGDDVKYVKKNKLVLNSQKPIKKPICEEPIPTITEKNVTYFSGKNELEREIKCNLVFDEIVDEGNYSNT